jgi:hypothetical protein
MSMLIAGLAGADFSCADTIGADKAQATIAEISIEVFIAIFPSGLNENKLLLLATVGSQELPSGQRNGSANKLTSTGASTHRSKVPM